jgi:uncharacterized protein YkwD
MNRWLVGLLLPLALTGCSTNQLAQVAVSTLAQAVLGGPGAPITFGGSPAPSILPGGSLAAADQPPTGPYAQLIQQAHDRINQERAKLSVKPLILDARLSEVANQAAAANRDTPGDHVDAEGMRLAAAGIDASTLANHLTRVQGASGTLAVENLLASPAHHDGLISSAFGHVGYGIYVDGTGGYWWVMDEVR